MKITVEFNSLQELDEFCNGVVIAPGLAQKAREENAQQPQEEPKKAEAKKSTPKKTEAKEEAKTETVEPPHGVDNEDPIDAEPKKVEKKEAAPDVSKLQVEVRKMLAQVNKKTGTNTASQWIKELTSVEKLTEVQNADELLALKAKAEEVLNG